MGFVIIFDLPFGLETEKRRLNIKLKRIGTKLLQQSVWKSDDLKSLIEIGSWIRSLGGKAEILEEKFLF